jgi:crotonobetainyl-CoA:carnitine CoA-transferase CaiB-like acyl-CoA transferase
MTADPQVQARGFFVPLEAGPTPMPGNPIKLRGCSSDDWTPCPRLGADNAGVLQDWLGYPEAQIKKLEQTGVLVDKPPA